MVLILSLELLVYRMHWHTFRILSLVHNHFGKSRETDYSPLELAVGRRLTKPTTTMFGAVILAELPDSLKSHSPNETRYIEASYIHCGIGKRPIVSGCISIDGELELRRFVARNVRSERCAPPGKYKISTKTQKTIKDIGVDKIHVYIYLHGCLIFMAIVGK